MIYLLILLLSILSALSDRYVFKEYGRGLTKVMEYAVFYHFLVVLIRTITSGGSDYLSFSFYGKTAQG